MNAVRVRITPELLLQAMRFPEGTVMLSAAMADGGRYVLVTLEHPDLPSVLEGAQPSFATPTFRRNYEETEPRVEFVDWGVQ